MPSFTHITDKSAGGAKGNILRDGGNSSFNSLEQFITPIQIQKNHPAAAALPGFRKPKATDEQGVFGPEKFVGPTVHNLDPYFPLDNYQDEDDGSKFFERNDFVSVYSNAADSNGGPQLDLSSYVVADRGKLKNINAVRINALRGPLILSGWGYGSDDMPQPNRGPKFPFNGFFHPETSSNRSKWKTGPVHLMWDDERQVWHGGPRVVCGVVQGEIKAGKICEPTEFKVKLLRNTKNEDKGGGLTDDTNEIITVKNRDPSLEQAKVENQIFCMAIKINYEWLPLWVGCPDTPACGKEGQPDPPECIDSECEEEP